MSEITYPFDKTVPTEEPARIVPNIHWLRMPLPFVLNHVNIWLLQDEGGWCTVDTGVTWDTGKSVWNRCLCQYTLVRQVVTHYHPDHIGLAGWLEQKTGASVWMTRGEYLTALACRNQLESYSVDAMIRLFEWHGLDESRVKALKVRGHVYGQGCPVLPSTCHYIRDGDRITIGSHEWEVIAGYGHAAEHASFYCRELNILISGDMLLPSISTNIPVMAVDPLGNPLKEFLESVRRFLDLPADTLVLPSHGRPFLGIHARVRFLEEHHRSQCHAVLRACAVPRTACELLPVLFEREIVDAHQYMFAMGESIAHLNYLEKQRKLKRLERDGVIRFVTA